MLAVFLLVAPAAAYTQYCKCDCTKGAVVGVVDKCLNCTLATCQEACGEKVEMAVTCFQRESLKEQVVVYMFLAAVVGLVGMGMARRG